MDSPVISSLQVKGSGQDLSSRNVDFSHEKSRGGNRQGVAGSLPPALQSAGQGSHARERGVWGERDADQTGHSAEARPGALGSVTNLNSSSLF